jgi:hypothetical protein
MAMLSGGADIFRAVVVSLAVTVRGRSWRGWFEERAAQVLEQPEAVGRLGQAAPAAGGAVQDGAAELEQPGADRGLGGLKPGASSHCRATSWAASAAASARNYANSGPTGPDFRRS